MSEELFIRMRSVMASTGFAFSDVHRRDSRSTSDLPLTQERDPSQRLVDDERPSCEENASVPARETTAPLSSAVNEDPHLDEKIGTVADFEGIVGQSSALRQVLQLVDMLATSDSSGLLPRETGTGEQPIAQASHD